jgi:hypothetical protein
MRLYFGLLAGLGQLPRHWCTTYTRPRPRISIKRLAQEALTSLIPPLRLHPLLRILVELASLG